MSISGINFISQPITNSVNIIVDNDFSHGEKHPLLHKHIWINNEYVIKESDLDVFFNNSLFRGAYNKRYFC